MNLMDEPIFYTHHKASVDDLVPDKDKLCLDQKFVFALVNDDKDEYMRLAKQVGSEKLRGHFKAMFMNDALEIFKAFETLIDVKDLLEDGKTLLHLAVFYFAPRLTKYFLDLGVKVDAVCFISKWNLKDVTPLDLSMHVICIGDLGNLNLHDLLWWVCFHNRKIMEIIRMFVRHAQGETWARKAFVGYACKGELHKSAALFLAVPELFFSPPQKELCFLRKFTPKTLNSWENATFLKDHLSLFIDVFTFVGLKLAAYIRLKEYDFDYFSKGRHLHLEIDYFLHEVADRKIGRSGSSRDYYYLRFLYAADGSRTYWIDDDDDWDTCTSSMTGTNVFFYVSYLLNRNEFERDAIYSLIPRLEKQDADLLSSAIEKKLSSLEGETIQQTKKMATVNCFDLFIDDDAGYSAALIAFYEQKAAAAAYEQKAAAAAVATTKLAKLPSRPLPLAQAVREASYAGVCGSGTRRGSEIKRDGAGRGNWGTANDDIAWDVEEPIAENEVNVVAEKPAGEEENVVAKKETTVNKAEEEPEEKRCTLEKYEIILEEKRKVLLSLSEQKKGEERKIDVEEFPSMHLISKKKNDEVFIKLDSETDKRRESAEREKKSKKSVSINESLMSAEGETLYRSDGRRRGRRCGGCGGYARSALVIEDKSQFPPLSLLKQTQSTMSRSF